jgi:hypothetical protein
MPPRGQQPGQYTLDRMAHEHVDLFHGIVHENEPLRVA